MGRHDRLRGPHLADLVFLASTASALSLFNFQPITSTQVPISCILAYDSEISGCESSDFTEGQTCSASCIRGLERVQSTLESICYDVDVSSDSVLGQALLGNLVGLLCPGNGGSGSGGTTTTTVFDTRTSTAAVVLPSSPVRTLTPKPPQTPASKAPTTSSAIVVQSEPQPTETLGDQSTAVPLNTPTETATTIQVSTSTTSQQTTPTSDSSPGPTSNSGRGGGGPFDITTAEDNSSPRLAVRWPEALVTVAVLGLLLLR